MWITEALTDAALSSGTANICVSGGVDGCVDTPLTTGPCCDESAKSNAAGGPGASGLWATSIAS